MEIAIRQRGIESGRTHTMCPQISEDTLMDMETIETNGQYSSKLQNYGKRQKGSRLMAFWLNPALEFTFLYHRAKAAVIRFFTQNK